MTRVRFFQNREGRRIAYADEGEGPVVALPAWWLSHLERDPEDPAYLQFFAKLAERFRMIRYDRIGVGMSDRVRATFTLESELADFAALVDHIGAPRVHMLAFSCAGPVALAYAARFPERVDRLALYGSYLHGEALSPLEMRGALVGLVRGAGKLGSRTLADVFHPHADPDTRGRIDQLQRASADPEMAARLLELTFALDARPFVKEVRTPVLVVHRKDDPTIAAEHGRSLAAAITGATLVTMPGRCHMPWHEDSDAIVRAVCEFLGAIPGPSIARDDAAELRRDGEIWRLVFAGRQALLRDSKGLSDLARLLGRPGEAIHVLDLIGADSAERRDASRGDAALDARALADLRRRVGELGAALADAEDRADLGRRYQLTAEREALLERLAADVGLRGRVRRIADPVERARKAVAARVRDAIRRVKAADLALGEHLEAAVQTGVMCAYRPTTPIRWTVSPDST